MVFRVLNVVYVLMWEQRTQRLRDKTIIYVCFFIVAYFVLCDVFHFTGLQLLCGKIICSSAAV